MKKQLNISCRNCGNFQMGYGFGYKAKNKGSGPRIYQECIFKLEIEKKCKESNFDKWIMKGSIV